MFKKLYSLAIALAIALPSFAQTGSGSLKDVIKDEKLEENAERLGKIFRNEFSSIKSDMIELVRGKGLLNAVVIRNQPGKTAWDVCVAMAENGVLAKPTHGNIIRFAPQLVMNEEQLRDCIAISKKTISEF